MKTTINLLLVCLLLLPIMGFGKCFVTISPCLEGPSPFAKMTSCSPLMPFTNVLIPPSCGSLSGTDYCHTFNTCGSCNISPSSMSLLSGYIPPAGQCVYDVFLLENCLPNGICILDTVIVNVDPICIIIGDDTYLTPVDSMVVLYPNPVANDSTIGQSTLNPCDLTIIEPVSSGSLMMMGQNCDLVYTPNPGFSGTDSFIYEICSNGFCNSGVVTIYVSNTVPTVSEWGMILTSLLLLLLGSKKIVEIPI